MAISMLKIRRPLGRLIFNMGIAIPGNTVFLFETAPWVFLSPHTFHKIAMNEISYYGSPSLMSDIQQKAMHTKSCWIPSVHDKNDMLYCHAMILIILTIQENSHNLRFPICIHYSNGEFIHIIFAALFVKRISYHCWCSCLIKCHKLHQIFQKMTHDEKWK